MNKEKRFLYGVDKDGVPRENKRTKVKKYESCWKFMGYTIFKSRDSKRWCVVDGEIDVWCCVRLLDFRTLKEAENHIMRLRFMENRIGIATCKGRIEQ